MDPLPRPRPAFAVTLVAWWLVLFAALAPVQADWRSELTPPKPGAFPLPQPVEAKYHFGWSGLTAGYLTASFSKVQGQKITLDATGRTSGIARGLWRLDATHHAVANARTLQPISLEQKEVYSDKTVTTKVRFAGKSLTKTREVSVDKGPVKPKRMKLPEAFDLQTALLFVRSQPLRKGDEISLVVLPPWSPYLATIKVLGSESVTVRAGKFDCLKLDLRLQSISKKLELQPHQSFKRGTIWVSNDGKRLLVKASVDIFIGSVWAELDSATSSASAN